MTTYRVPYTFIPGTKAKATEVNANFNAITELIEESSSNNADKNLSNLTTAGKNVIYNNAPSSKLLGEIITSPIPLMDSCLHLLDGALIIGNGMYDDFVTFIADLYTSKPDLFVTEEDWQLTVNEYGVCGKFVYDEDNNTVRLPKFTGFIEGCLSESVLGEINEAGLPNITGKTSTGTTAQYIEGAFAYGGAFSGAGQESQTCYWNSFDASRCSSLYGNSTTVQPQSINVFYYIVVSSVAKIDAVADIDQIATDLNNKADKDLSNVTAPHIVEVSDKSLMPSWYRLYSDGWCEQGGVMEPYSGYTTVTFLKEYSHIPTVFSNFTYTNPEVASYEYINVQSVTKSSFQTRTFGQYNQGTFWIAQGYIN